jgi:hypothetical protein
MSKSGRSSPAITLNKWNVGSQLFLPGIGEYSEELAKEDLTKYSIFGGVPRMRPAYTGHHQIRILPQYFFHGIHGGIGTDIQAKIQIPAALHHEPQYGKSRHDTLRIFVASFKLFIGTGQKTLDSSCAVPQ